MSVAWQQQWRDLLEPGAAEDFFHPSPVPEFAPVEGRFSASLAWWLAEFCRLSYRQERDERPQQAEAQTRAEILGAVGGGWSEVRFFNGLKPGGKRHRRPWRPALPVEDTQATLLHYPSADCWVLAFRGTLSFMDLLTDAAFLAWPLRFKLKGSAHHGFQAGLDSIWPEVLHALTGTSGKIILTGHSLGGALATLAACRLLSDPALAGRVSSLYTFGSPRVGTAGFAENFPGLYHARVVHGDDLVTQVPPAFALPPFPPYRHVGWRCRLYEDGRIEQSPQEHDDARNRQEGIFETWRLLRGLAAGVKAGKLGELVRSLKDHTPLLYSRALRAAVLRT